MREKGQRLRSAAADGADDLDAVTVLQRHIGERAPLQHVAVAGDGNVASG